MTEDIVDKLVGEDKFLVLDYDDVESCLKTIKELDDEFIILQPIVRPKFLEYKLRNWMLESTYVEFQSCKHPAYKNKRGNICSEKDLVSERYLKVGESLMKRSKELDMEFECIGCAGIHPPKVGDMEYGKFFLMKNKKETLIK